MIRPCDQCQGSGQHQVEYIDTESAHGCDGTEADCQKKCPIPIPVERIEAEPCPRCVGMKRLHRGYLKSWYVVAASDHSDGDAYREALKRGWFTPDPGSVMEWCFEHGSVVYTDGQCEYLEIDERWDALDATACRIGWVPRPTEPLEVVE